MAIRSQKPAFCDKTLGGGADLLTSANFFFYVSHSHYYLYGTFVLMIIIMRIMKIHLTKMTTIISTKMVEEVVILNENVK